MHYSPPGRREVSARLIVGLALSLASFGAFATVASADPGNGSGEGQGNGNGAAQSEANASLNSDKHQTEGTAGTVGDPTQPQPLSNADQNGNGANVSGGLNNTRAPRRTIAMPSGRAAENIPRIGMYPSSRAQLSMTRFDGCPRKP